MSLNKKKGQKLFISPLFGQTSGLYSLFTGQYNIKGYNTITDVT